METLNSDLLSLIGLELDIVDLSAFCQSSKFLYDKIWQNKYFWIRKTQRDFNFHKNYKLIHKEKSLSKSFSKYCNRDRISNVEKSQKVRQKTMEKLIDRNDIETILYLFDWQTDTEIVENSYRVVKKQKPELLELFLFSSDGKKRIFDMYQWGKIITIASKKGDFELVLKLLTKNNFRPDIYFLSKAIFAAAKSGNRRLIDFFIELGAAEHEIICAACCYNLPDYLEKYLKDNTAKEIIIGAFKNAIYGGNIEIAQKLLERFDFLKNNLTYDNVVPNLETSLYLQTLGIQTDLKLAIIHGIRDVVIFNTPLDPFIFEPDFLLKWYSFHGWEEEVKGLLTNYPFTLNQIIQALKFSIRKETMQDEYGIKTKCRNRINVQKILLENLKDFEAKHSLNSSDQNSYHCLLYVAIEHAKFEINKMLFEQFPEFLKGWYGHFYYCSLRYGAYKTARYLHEVHLKNPG